ncbi:AAA family ATPase [Leifsonia sp. H3M29-4]|uniref:AAA family ATPase n=1 Tax=Salinibacterium metalliresistens TaxID=3031321 RepID=UPI0023DA2A2B|nr:AAA family ATPase [Salinibacterium metalliresistens]MDF1477565.1 AAA family ATPase [Salinibacterium metalliresistens]
MIRTLAVEGYRSLRSLVVPLGALTVVTGPNGSGKSSLYRALRLLAACSMGGAVAALAQEGGLRSTLWAGPETVARRVASGEFAVQGTARSAPVALRLGFSGDEFGYAIDFGLPIPSQTMFGLDPEIKAEAVFSGAVLRPATALTERHGPAMRMRDDDGAWRAHDHRLRPFDSMLAEFADPRLTPELLELRERMRSWRFYDHFRTDAGAPARASRLGTRTPVLAHDGSDLAAALQTIREQGRSDELDHAVSAAFPGAHLEITGTDGWFSLGMRQPGMLRPLAAAELSDGTLRYLLWIAALLSTRPPALLVLNEPETSLHPDLIEPLGQLIAAAAERTQTVVVSHSPRLIAALDAAGASRIELAKSNGETSVVDQGLLDAPAWQWPKR